MKEMHQTLPRAQILRPILTSQTDSGSHRWQQREERMRGDQGESVCDSVWPFRRVLLALYDFKAARLQVSKLCGVNCTAT